MKRHFKSMMAVLLTMVLSLSATGCGPFFSVKSEELQELLSEVEETVQEAEDSQENKADSDDKESGDKETVSYGVDSSYAGLTEEEISEDLLAWLNACYAIQTDANDLDVTIIGGMATDDPYIDYLKNGLQAGWGITDKDSTLEIATKLMADDGDSNNDGWNYSRAVELLAQGYSVGWLSLDEYLEYAVPVGRMIQARFDSWDEFGDNYLLGYMTWISNGGYGYAGDINARCASHQYFVTAGEYYTGPYAVDFDMELKPDAIASYYDNLDPNKEIPGDDKVSEHVKAYIEPQELGIKLTSGTLEIDGDLYHMPVTIKAFLDNDWVVSDDSKNVQLSWNKKEDVTLTRNGKELTLGTNSYDKCSSAVENGVVYQLNIKDGSDISYVLPGGITASSTKEDIIAAIETGDAGDYKDGTQLEISLAGIAEERSTSRITFMYNSKAITIRCGFDNKETAVRNQVYGKLAQHIADANERKMYLDSKFGGSADAVTLDDLSANEFMAGNKAFKVNQTIKELTDAGWIIDDDDYSDDIVVEPDGFVTFYIKYQGIDSAGVLWGFKNRTDSPVKITDAVLNTIHPYDLIWRKPDTMPFKVAKDITLELSTYDDLVEAFGEPYDPGMDKNERNGRTSTIYEYDVKDGTVRFYIDDEDKTITDIVLMEGGHRG